MAGGRNQAEAMGAWGMLAWGVVEKDDRAHPPAFLPEQIAGSAERQATHTHLAWPVPAGHSGNGPSMGSRSVHAVDAAALEAADGDAASGKPVIHVETVHATSSPGRLRSPTHVQSPSR
eukprot:356188-Chlamydomonas_euryale.AAC.11